MPNPRELLLSRVRRQTWSFFGGAKGEQMLWFGEIIQFACFFRGHKLKTCLPLFFFYRSTSYT